MHQDKRLTSPNLSRHVCNDSLSHHICAFLPHLSLNLNLSRIEDNHSSPQALASIVRRPWPSCHSTGSPQLRLEGAETLPILPCSAPYHVCTRSSGTWAGAGVESLCNPLPGQPWKLSLYTSRPRDHVEPTPPSCWPFDLSGVPTTQATTGNHHQGKLFSADT